MGLFRAFRNAIERAVPRIPTFELCGIHLPLELAKLGVMVMGRPRSGKTTIIFLMMMSVMEAAHRTLCFDIKGEYAPRLRAVLGADRVTVCAPFEPGTARWDWAKDIHSFEDADAFGILFAPQPGPQDHNPFFAERANDLYKGVLRGLHYTRPGDYNFRDVNKAFSTEGNLRACLLGGGEENERIANSLNEKRGENADVIRTMHNVASQFEALQRRFDTLTLSFTLTDWVANDAPRGTALVVGNSHRNKRASQTLTRALLQRATDLMLDGPDSQVPHSFVYLDELQSAGALELTDLLSKGASRGIVTTLGFHSVATLKKIHGPDGADELSSYCAFKVFCGLNDHLSAKWASELWGERDDIVLLQSESWNDGPQPTHGRTMGEHLHRAPVLTPQALLRIKPFSPPEVTHLGMYLWTPFGACYYDGLTLELVKRLFPQNEPQAVRLLPAAAPQPAAPRQLKPQDDDRHDAEAPASASSPEPEPEATIDSDDNLPYLD